MVSRKIHLKATLDSVAPARLIYMMKNIINSFNTADPLGGVWIAGSTKDRTGKSDLQESLIQRKITFSLSSRTVRTIAESDLCLHWLWSGLLFCRFFFIWVFYCWGFFIVNATTEARQPVREVNCLIPQHCFNLSLDEFSYAFMRKSPIRSIHLI